MKKSLPKVLVVSTNAWRENTGINTLIELFKCWESDKISQIYTKPDLPRTAICSSFFRISEKDVLKSVLSKSVRTGEIVQNEFHDEDRKKITGYICGNKLRHFFSICREIVWLLGKWKTDELDEFIDKSAPDVLFIPIYPTIYMGRIQKYIINRTNVPVVSYIADDNYTYKPVRKTPIELLERYLLRKTVKSIVEKSKYMMVITEKQKAVYDKIFDINSIVLTKGIDFAQYPFECNITSLPLKMVYTGKLIIGRWRSLAAIAKALESINSDGTKIELYIYTTDYVSYKQKRALNKNGCYVKGALPLDQVEEVQKKADVLVFVESLEKTYKYAAWLSFSTKITDYLRMGKCIFAIGDEEIAPIDYFRRNRSAIIASNYKEIKEKLKMMIYNKAIIPEMAQRAYDCGVKNHNRKDMDELLMRTILNAKSHRY